MSRPIPVVSALAVEYGRRITEERNRVGLTQYELSLRAGVSQSTLCRWERGQIFPDDLGQRKIAAALNLSPGFLFPKDMAEQ